MKKLRLSVLIAFIVISCVSCTSQQESKVEGNAQSQTEVGGQASVKYDERLMPDALELARSDDNFSTLVKAIEAAEVEDEVVNAGPLTVFAPTNDAFNQLPEGTLADLLKPENKEKLSYILVSHVAPSNYDQEMLKKLASKQMKLFMASGVYLPVEVEGDKIKVGGATILKSVKVSNGWVHVIDKVIIPENN